MGLLISTKIAWKIRWKSRYPLEENARSRNLVAYWVSGLAFTTTATRRGRTDDERYNKKKGKRNEEKKCNNCTIYLDVD